MSTPLKPFYQLKCSCNQYPWGKQGRESLAARLCEKTPGWDGPDGKQAFEIDNSKPYAEMWMGTYPDLPSYVASTGEDLQDVLDRYPKELLGEAVISKFGHTKLPYLPKVLSIAKALPLQIHPNKDFSARMHKENPSSFTDPNHKPEIAVALSEFEAFCGFKPLDAIAYLLELEPLKHFGFSAGSSDSFTDGDLRKLVRSLLEADQDTIKKLHEGLASLPDSAFKGDSNAYTPKLLPRLASDFSPADPGILVALLTMNYLVLQPGEAIYIPADGIHAYLAGDIIECMARSNNVLNTGFCPRADRDNAAQFCDLLTFRPHDRAQSMLPSQDYNGSGKGKTKVFEPPMSEFNMLVTELKAGETEVLGKMGPSIVLATEGGAKVKANDEDSFILSQGHVYFVSQGVKLELEAGDDGLLLHTAYVE